MKIVDGLMKRAYKPVSQACPVTIKYANGITIEIPAECVTRTGQLKAHVTKAVLLKQYAKLMKYGVKVTRQQKGAV